MKIERVIDASAERVWSLLSDVESWGRLLPTMEAVNRLDADADGAVDGEGGSVGTRYVVRQPGLPKAVYEITEWRPGAGFTWTSSAVGVRTTATHEIDDDNGKARLTLGIEWAGPLAGLVRVLLGVKTRRMVEQEADTFARLAEAGDGDAHGG